MTVKVNGKTSNYLTTGVDTAIVTGTDKDIIYGAMTSDPVGPGNTFNTNDTIVGNGKTVLNLNVSDITGTSGSPTAMPGVDITGLRTLNIKNLTDNSSGSKGYLKLDASTWGSSLETIALSGSKALNLAVTGLTVGQKLNVSASGDTQGVVVTDAVYGASTVTAEISNVKTDATNAKAVVTGAKLNAVAGAGDSSSLTHNVKGAPIGDLSLSLVQAKSASATGATVTANWGDTGTTTIGAITIDKLQATGAKADVKIIETARDVGAGASIGNLTINKLVIGGNAAAGSDLSVNYKLDSKAALGDAKVGNVSINSVTATQTGGLGANDLTVAVSSENTGAGVATVGQVNIGSITADGVLGGFKTDLSVKTLGGGGLTKNGNSIAGLSVGAVDIGTVGGDGLLKVVTTTQAGAIGNVSLGNVDLSAAAAVAGAAKSTELYVDVSAATALGNVTVGNVAIDSATTTITAVDAYNTVGGAALSFKGDSVGNVSVGNFTVRSDGAVTKSGLGFNGLKVAATGVAGSVGTVDVGTVVLNATQGTTGAFGTFDLDVTASKIGASSIKSISIASGSATGARDATLDVDFDASGTGVIGAVSVGEVALLASTGSKAILNVDLSGGALTTGALSFGNVSLLGQASAGQLSKMTIDVASTGDITVKNITVGQNVVGTGATLATADFDTTGGNITLGNIKVSGNALNGNFSVLDSKAASGSTWLHADTTGVGKTVTVGNIDYSAFDGKSGAGNETIIDVSDWLGASEILGVKSGDSKITGNLGQNTVTLTVGAGVDTIYFAGVQANGIVGATADLINNFNGGGGTGHDFIDIKTTAGTSETVSATIFGTEAAFLAAAATDNSNVYAARVGNTWYVAVDVDTVTSNTTDYIFKVNSVNNLDAADFVTHT